MQGFIDHKAKEFFLIRGLRKIFSLMGQNILVFLI